MQRRDFLALTGLTAGGLIVPSFFGKVIAAEQLQSSLDLGLKKRLADAALAAARQAGATYCDVRIGRYLRQFVITREDKVQNVVNTESTGVGIRVIVNGAWGFAATNALSTADVARAAQQAAAAQAGIEHLINVGVGRVVGVFVVEVTGVGDVRFQLVASWVEQTGPSISRLCETRVTVVWQFAPRTRAALLSAW